MAERFWVSLSCVETLWRRFRRSGNGAAKPHAGGKHRARVAVQSAAVATAADGLSNSASW